MRGVGKRWIRERVGPQTPGVHPGAGGGGRASAEFGWDGELLVAEVTENVRHTEGLGFGGGRWGGKPVHGAAQVRGVLSPVRRKGQWSGASSQLMKQRTRPPASNPRGERRAGAEGPVVACLAYSTLFPGYEKKKKMGKLASRECDASLELRRYDKKIFLIPHRFCELAV